jgi:DNA-binding response OmpR family regulator
MLAHPSLSERPSRALLVESDPDWRKVLHPFLERSGMAVAACATAGEALKALEALPGFAFAFIELELPDLPGWQLWNRLCTDPGNPRAVFWGQSSERWERLNLQNHPSVFFLRKPFRREELRSAIEELRRRRGF